MQSITRREFLKMVGGGVALTTAGSWLASCAPAPEPTKAPTLPRRRRRPFHGCQANRKTFSLLRAQRNDEQ